MQLMDDQSSKDVKLIFSYDDNEIGSVITTNYVVIKNNLTIRQAMHALVRQAGDHDNISTIYVTDDQERYFGAIDLKDLIIAREGDILTDIVSTSYSYVHDHEHISDCIERIKEYAEDSIPVLREDGIIVGIITAQDIVEVVDDEMGDDYAKLAGLTAEEDLKETTLESMKKRLPWLIVLLFLGMAVSSVVRIFESVVAVLPIVMCFQSLILDMAGNVGIALLVAMIISSMVGTLIPMFFHKIKVDPAVASGPLITTVNDLVAVITYYGLAWLLLIHVMQII